MSNGGHPIEHEELMAYLDGELATERAVAAAAHLEHCQECQELAAELRKISLELMAWEVEESGYAEMPTEVVVVLEKRGKGPVRKIVDRWTWRMLFTPRMLAWSGGIAVFVLLVIAVSIPNLLRSPHSAKEALRLSGERATSAPALSQTYAYDSLERLKTDNVPPSQPAPSSPHVSLNLQDEHRSRGTRGNASEDEEIDNSERTLDLPTVPMIARTAGLTLVTKEFDKTRANLEEILKRHGGYLGELKVSAPADAGRTLTAALRIPAPQLEAAMAELKNLGRVEDESQGGEEVTQQYVDLEARLKNSQHTEQRLTEILRTRTGKLQEVLKVELEIDRVRGEIEQMQAEKKELSKRVAFATLNTTVKEEYRAKLEATPPSTASRFRNAAVDGYNTVVEGLIDVALFLLSAGPSLLLWAAVLFFPARWAWKKLRKKPLEPEIPSA